ncbi:hypothetical protein OUZ56_031339 [Daphnia magna]|uniref:Uncharacterized protein n=1 Tax=Daphnia magna TaxID=35525 RepID=A0ABQ9ZUC7_9CRUS|nr:hypothetical protein OUZ56_031339 [Daphnia magna]
MFVFASSMGRSRYVEKMATEICDVDDVVKETSSYSTTDSHMPLIDDLRSETATTSNHIYSLNNDNEEAYRLGSDLN